MELSLIIPAFNEAQRIGPTLRRFRQFLAARPASFEIIVVDDGSADDTEVLVAALAVELPELRVICSPTNRGKGHAVRVGMQAATGRIRLFSDADGSTSISELDKLLQALAEGGRYCHRLPLPGGLSGYAAPAPVPLGVEPARQPGGAAAAAARRGRPPLRLQGLYGCGVRAGICRLHGGWLVI